MLYRGLRQLPGDVLYDRILSVVRRGESVTHAFVLISANQMVRKVEMIYCSFLK